eukprot:364942-Chlamydomonas_euryale.AAC.4
MAARHALLAMGQHENHGPMFTSLILQLCIRPAGTAIWFRNPGNTSHHCSCRVDQRHAQELEARSAPQTCPWSCELLTHPGMRMPSTAGFPEYFS